MKRLAIVAITISSAAIFALPAAAAPWMSINHRQANLEYRINQGVRTGRLTRTEAGHLRTKYRDLVRLEARYRHTGGRLTTWERRDLDRKMNQISYHISYQARDRQHR